MLEKISNGWQFAKDSFSIVRHHKRLIVLPIVSMIAATLVVISFIAPLWASGTAESWMETTDESGNMPVAAWVTLFAFYFCNYFVIVFFNCALIACTMQALRGEEVQLGYGFSMAAKRLPQIAGWAFVSALVGVLLRALEQNDKIARVVSAILGTAWTVLTYFAIPFIVMEGAGPIAAIKSSASTVKKTWGESLVGHFSLGLIGFLISLPVILLGIGLIYLASQSGSAAMVVLAIVVTAVGILLAAAISSAADIIFKGLMYNYATGRDLPAGIDTNKYEMAFASKG